MLYCSVCGSMHEYRLNSWRRLTKVAVQEGKRGSPRCCGQRVGNGTGFGKRRVEQLVKRGLVVAKPADGTRASAGVSSPSEKQAGGYAWLLWLVGERPWSLFSFCTALECSQEEFSTSRVLQYLGELQSWWCVLLFAVWLRGPSLV